MSGVTLTPETAVIYRVLLEMARVPDGELKLPWCREHGVRAVEIAEKASGAEVLKLRGGDAKLTGGAVSPRLNVLAGKGLAVNDPLTARWAATPWGAEGE